MLARVAEQPWLFLHGLVKVDWPEATTEPQTIWVLPEVELSEGEEYYFELGPLL